MTTKYACKQVKFYYVIVAKTIKFLSETEPWPGENLLKIPVNVPSNSTTFPRLFHIGKWPQIHTIQPNCAILRSVCCICECRNESGRKVAPNMAGSYFDIVLIRCGVSSKMSFSDTQKHRVTKRPIPRNAFGSVANITICRLSAQTVIITHSSKCSATGRLAATSRKRPVSMLGIY